MRIRFGFALGILAFSAWATSSIAWGATSAVWEVTGYNDFLKGRISGLSLTADGALKPGPVLHFTESLGQPALWSLAAAPDGSIYSSTGHRGRIFRTGADGKSQLVWSAAQSEVFAIAVDRKGVLYAGSSPNGGVFRIDGSKAVEIWHSPAKYIWALAVDGDGTVYVATGDQGKIYRIAPNGKDDLYYETGQANVTALALGSGGKLYAGSEPNGLLYEISGPKQGSILYDSPLPEIRAIAVAPNGTIYAAAMGGSVASRTAAATTSTTSSGGAVTATTPTVVTVAEAAQNEQQPSEIKPKPDQPRGTASSTLLTGSQAPTSQVVDVSGVDKSAIYRIGTDRTVETLRMSKEDNVYDLFLDGDDVVFSTDVQGRIYRLMGSRPTLLAETGDGEVTRLLKSSSGFYAALSSPARLLSFTSSGASTGIAAYESTVRDSTSIARWGHLRWHGSGSGIVFRTRTGNAIRPDSTWSPWSEPLRDPAAASITSPNARFIQWRAEWPAGTTAELDTVDIGYLPQNTPPTIRSITVTPVLATNPAKASVSNAASSSAYSVTVTDTGDAPAAASGSTAGQIVSRQTITQAQVSWQADDADGDKLVYSVYVRGEDEKEWQLVRTRMFENALLMDADTLADGRYYFRVVASDSPSNAADYARQFELVSSPVLIDNTPPVITPGLPHRNGTTLDMEVEAEDKTSALRRCEFSLDAGSWQQIEATDGVTDFQHERFRIHLEKLRPGEHLLVFRVYDSANNAGLAKVVVR